MRALLVKKQNTVYLLAKLGFECPIMGPEPVCSISMEVFQKVAKDWTNRERHSYKVPLQIKGRSCYN
jgi:hypothetical protein